MHMAGLRGSRLSTQQTHLWGLQQNQQAYWVQGAFLLEGPLQLSMLHLAFEDIILQQEILRTIFHRLPGMDVPVQVVNAETALAWDEIHTQDQDPLSQQQYVENTFAEVRMRPHDLSSDPVVHATLLSCTTSKTLLLISVPALCADMPTLQYFVSEVAQAYLARVHNRPGTLNGEEILQFTDISAWQHEILEEDDAHLHQTFWTQKDLSTLPSLHLPFSHSSIADLDIQRPFSPEKLTIELSNLMPSVASLEQQDITSEAFFLACWQILLWRVTGEDGIPLGVAFNGRNYEELENTFGPYTRTVPLLAEFTADTTLEQLLQQLQSTINRSCEEQLYFQWQSIPAFRDKPLADHFFPLSFAFEHWPKIVAEDVHFTFQENFGWSERFVLRLVVQQVAATLQCELQYDAAYVQLEQAQQTMNALRTLLEAATTQWQTPISHLPIIERSEEERLLATFRGPEQNYPAHTLSQLFEEQAEKSAGKIAVISGDQQLTYKQLHTRANQLAHWLRQHGVGPDTLVCLYLERGIDSLVSLLAVLKAGGAYVPLDPDLPQVRLAFQLDDTQAPILLTHEHLLPRIPAFTGQILCLDRDEALLSNEPTTNPPSTAQANHLAYVIYTSGSTGMPKGVLIQQRSVLNYIYDMCKRIAPQSGLHFATVSTLSADLGNTSIFTSFASGGCLHILSYETLTSGETFANYIQRYPVDVLKIVPSHLQALLASSNDREILPRRYLVLGGETLTHSFLHTLRQRGARCAIINHYGPTETTIGALVHELDTIRSQESDDTLPSHNKVTTVPIGHPISNVQVCVVDQYQHIVPVGVTGELLISGAGLAAGYLHQEELTQARFLPHPFLKESHQYVYKTGDLARYTADGLIEFIGRADRQVKLRGYRIELGEIEATLRRHPQVLKAVAVLREDITGDKRIIAYVVNDQQPLPSPLELRNFLHTALPEYMVPTLIMPLPALPLTTNGKINYQALPLPEQNTNNTHSLYMAPRNPIEDILVTIWQDVLQSSHLSIHDDFFASGGHSLLVTQVIARIQKTLQVSLPISSIFESPTVARLATLVESALRDDQPQPVPPLTTISRDQDLPLSFSQQRLWFLHQLDPDSPAYNVPFALHIKGNLSVEALEYSLGEIIKRHEILRTTFSTQKEHGLQYIHPWSEYHLEQKELHATTPQEREDAIVRQRQEEAQCPFDLSQGPLFRALLLHVHDDEYVLLLTMHHIVSDGWSNSIMFGELQAFYIAYQEQKTAQLTDMPIQYADYAFWQHQYLQGDMLNTQLSYWTQQLSEIPPLDLPTDYPRPSVQSFRGAELNYQLPLQLVADLKRLSQNEGATLFMTLLAAFQVLLAHYSGLDDIAVGTPTANRHHTSIENLIGPFINTLVLRANLSGNPTFREFLQRVRKVSLEAYARQDLPFEKIVEVLQPERDLSRTPLFQVMFGLQNLPMPDVNLNGLALNPYQGENTTSKFDLSLTTVENEQGLLCIMEYSTDLFKKETVERMMQAWSTLLQALINNPQCHIAALPVLGPDEQVLLHMYNHGPQLTIPEPLSMHRRFEDQVQLTPEAIALQCGDDQLSYQELNRCANRLARHLQALGVGPETPVALLAEREVHFLIAMLAIFKAGGAYLPLDPLHPAARLQQMLHTSGCALLLTTHTFSTTVEHIVSESSEMSVQVSYIEDLLKQAQSEENLPIADIPHHLAYVIYTSGSTGVPKGAMIEHAGMLNHLYAKITDLQLTAQDTIAQTASQCFDISVWQFLAALLVGGRVTIFSDSTAHDPTQMLLALKQHAISIYEVVPSVLKFLLDVLQENKHVEQPLPALRHLLATGEALPPMLYHRWRKFQSITPMVNAYGPTECSDDVTHHVVTLSPAETASTISIGRPVINTQIYILDQSFYPVPIGAYGEIYVGGIGVGRGYLHNPQRTAEAFLPNPFSDCEGARLYKTGDRARYLADGTIEFVGRIDYQVKIRGFRIELGEIETQLRHYPGVQDVVVMARGDSPEDKYLVAYLVTSMTISSSDLHVFLKEKLPKYMIPATFLLLDTLPLTTNGKIDLHALPVPNYSRAETGASYLAPRTPIEKMLTNIWELVLGNKQISITDNFFECGGHSLLATRVIAQAREAFQCDLPLRAIFEAPTIMSFAHYIEDVQRDNTSSRLPELQPAARPEYIPLSFAQQRLWFLDQLEPGRGVYNVPAALLLVGPFSIKAFTSSIQQIVQRHESLRTIFTSQQGIPIQVIMPFSPIQIPLLDLQTLPSIIQEEQVQYLAQLEARYPFDLSQGPLLRVHLLRLNKEKHILLLNMHHIISDGWSIDVLGRELSTLYQRVMQGKISALPPLPVQYADYALWQRAWLQGDIQQEQLDYWLHQLADAPTTLNFPLDRPRPALQSYTGARESVMLSLTLRRQLEQLSQLEGATLFMTLLASFQVLLMRYSGQTDIVVGTSVANRTQKNLENVIGFFVNTLAMRIDLSQNPSFRQLIVQAREVALQAYAHQDLTFEQLIAQLPIERNLSYHPLFQVAFEFQHTPFSAFELPGVAWSPLEFASTMAKFDLELTLAEEEQGLHCLMVYNTDLFDADTIRRFLNHFQMLLEGIVADPDQRVSTLPLLNTDERDTLLLHWNQTQRDLPQPLLFPQLFEQQVARIPDRIAVCDQQGQLTYAALWQHVQQLTAVLQQMGVGPEALVGIYLERSTAFLVSMLAIWQCSAAYVPLDPTYPAERLQFILNHAQAPLLITSMALAETLPQNHAKTLCLEQLPMLRTASYEPGRHFHLHPQQLAYVIYTSGSTGVPKGVMVTHDGMINHLWAKVATIALEEGDVVAQTASQSFDISVWQFLAALLQAGQVQILPDTISHDPFQLLGAIRERAISVLQVVPSLLRALLDEPDSSSYLQTALRWVIVTGEAMPIDLCQRWWMQHTSIKLLNAYGPTECSDDVTHALLLLTEGQKQNWRVPIGFPIANVQLYVLDTYLQPVPIGVPGELYIGGIPVARGYWHRPEITATRFLPDPFSSQPGGRLYQTGDLVRYLPDGTLEYLGRLDQQVKLRGYRIELEEIQTVLHQHPNVLHAVAIVREDTMHDKRLVAYYIGQEGVTLTSAELRDHVNKQLPEYMVPSAFIQMPALPLTPNGKLDLKALPEPDLHAAPENAFTLPHTLIEETLVAIMAEVLGIKHISTLDNFFALGGHSLLATRIIAQAREAFQVELPLRALFETPTIVALSQHIERLQLSNASHRLPEIQPTRRPEHIPLSFAQQRLWFLYQLEPESSAYNIPTALRLSGSLAVNLLTQCIQQIVQRHENLRTTFVSLQGTPIQVIAPASSIYLPIFDLQGLPAARQEEQIQQLAQQEADFCFNLAIGPLLHVHLLRLAEKEHVLIFNIHHIISDAWSENVLINELTTLYRAALQGEKISLPALPIQYADYALWQQTWLQGDVFTHLTDYWKQQLANMPPLLPLPTSKPRPQVQSSEGKNHRSTIVSSLASDLKQISRETNVTPFMTFLTAFSMLLSYYSKQEDIVVGTDVANRSHQKAESLIGFFVNQLVLRINLSGDPSFQQTLQRVRTTTLDAYAHQDLPFDSLVQALNPPRSNSYLPLFQVKILFIDAQKQQFDLPNLSVHPLDIENTTSKLDITLFLVDNGQEITATWQYQPDLFSEEMIVDMAQHYQTLLSNIVAHPHERLSRLQRITETARRKQTMKSQKNQQASSSIKALRGITPKMVSYSQEEFVSFSSLSPDSSLPLVIQPNKEDIQLAQWAQSNREYLEKKLLQHGALLFRGFHIDTPPVFENFALVFTDTLFNENGEHPRVSVSGNIYTPVFFPPEEHLLWHNENSFNQHGPLKIWFACARPADHGGETPIVDSRKVFERIDPKIRERFLQKNIMYVRSYSDELGLNWQEVFRTTEKAEVEAKCRAEAMEFEWKDKGHLKTRCVRPAIVRHPQTGEFSWFNQAQHWHPACLNPQTRSALQSLFQEEDFPRNCYYGDGTPIEDSIMEEICHVYQELEVSFPWQRGDVIMLDNVLVAHARNPFQGERKILVAMGDMVNYIALQA